MNTMPRIAGAFWTGADWVTITRTSTPAGEQFTLAAAGQAPAARATGRVLARSLDPLTADRAARAALDGGFAGLAAERPLDEPARDRLRSLWAAGALPSAPVTVACGDTTRPRGHALAALRSTRLLRPARP